MTSHGSAARYIRGCRCDPCKAAHARRAAEQRAKRTARLADDPTIAWHGSASTYINWGCRCDECKAAHSVHLAKYRRGPQEET